MDFENNHPLHGAAAGLATAAVAKALGFENTEAVVAGAVVGGGLVVYMQTFGHRLPWDSGASSINSTIPRGGSPATPPKNAANIWGNIEASAVKQVQAFDAAVKKTAAQITTAQAAKPAATPRALAAIKAIPFAPLFL